MPALSTLNAFSRLTKTKTGSSLAKSTSMVFNDVKIRILDSFSTKHYVNSEETKIENLSKMGQQALMVKKNWHVYFMRDIV